MTVPMQVYQVWKKKAWQFPCKFNKCKELRIDNPLASLASEKNKGLTIPLQVNQVKKNKAWPFPCKFNKCKELRIDNSNLGSAKTKAWQFPCKFSKCKKTKVTIPVQVLQVLKLIKSKARQFLLKYSEIKKLRLGNSRAIFSKYKN